MLFDFYLTLGRTAVYILWVPLTQCFQEHFEDQSGKDWFESRGCVMKSLSSDTVQKLGCLCLDCGLEVWMFTSALLQVRFFIVLTVAVIPLCLHQFLSHLTENHSKLFAAFCRVSSDQHCCTVSKFPTASGFSRCDENKIEVQQQERMPETSPR